MKLTYRALFGAALSVAAQSHIALGDSNSAQTVANAVEAPIFADGKPIEFAAEGFTITPPAGWELNRSHPSLTLVASDTKVYETEINKEKIKFRRYLTVAAIKHPAPIDNERLKSFSAELTKLLGGENAHQNFQVTDVKAFNYRGQNDGILAYSTMVLNGVEMMQLHALVGGAERQFLMTYVDMADSFRAAGPEYQAAWGSMTSSQVSGEAPYRYQTAVKVAAAAGVSALLFLALYVWRRRNGSALYADIDADEFEVAATKSQRTHKEALHTSNLVEDDSMDDEFAFLGAAGGDSIVEAKTSKSTQTATRAEAAVDEEEDDYDTATANTWVLPKRYDVDANEAFVV
jgi:hypothetical protein